jgi:hypothetical protein
MTTFGLRKGQWTKAVIAAALALALVPTQGRCDSYSIYCMLIELATAQKPHRDCCCPSQCWADDNYVAQDDDGCTHSPCCPQGACTGARTMPCCPKCCSACDSESALFERMKQDASKACEKTEVADDIWYSEVFQAYLDMLAQYHRCACEIGIRPCSSCTSSYSQVFQAYLDMLADSEFEILEANAFEGRIRACKPLGNQCYQDCQHCPVCQGSSTNNCQHCPLCQGNSSNNCSHCQSTCEKPLQVAPPRPVPAPCVHCCPNSNTNCTTTEENRGGCASCPYCSRGNKPEHSDIAPCCQAALEKQAQVLRRLCGENQRTIHELEAIVMELCQEISMLRQDIQSLRQEDRARFIFLHEEMPRIPRQYNMVLPEEVFPPLPPNAGYFLPRWSVGHIMPQTPWIVCPQPVPVTSAPISGIEN